MSQMVKSIRGGQVWTEDGFVENRGVRLEHGKIRSVDDATVAEPAIDASDGLVVPGLVDIQVNGALGWSFQAEHQGHFDEIIAYHRQRGTTTLLPTLVTAAEQTLIESLALLSSYLDRAPQITLPGIHLEGPFLSPEKSGAHDPQALCLPDLAMAERFLTAANGRLALFTLAPELPGAPAVIERLAAQGVVVSAGHTAAGYAEFQSALAAGLSCVTHAGNASDWPHRAPSRHGFMASEPGTVGTLLAEPTLACGVILDGFHFHPALLLPLVTVKGRDHVLLVSDASPIAGCPPGTYESGGLSVTVHAGGFATSGRGGGWLAGSTITLLDAVQRSVALAGLPLHTALYMATLAPARLLGIEGQKGRVAAGHDADLLVLNHDLTVRHVIVGGNLCL